MARAFRRRHRQQPLVFSARGGKRRGAGRPPNGWRAGAPHKRREAFERPTAVHVTMRVEPAVGALRRRHAYHAFRQAMRAILVRRDFRIAQLSLEHDHVHALVEADSSAALASGMKAFQSSAAQRLNRALSRHTGVPRRGRVFSDRYDARILRSPTQARNALAYVLNNWRRHRLDDGWETQQWDVDFYSTGPTFRGWAELARDPMPFELPPTYEPLPTATPNTWLLAEGWRRGGPAISLREIPGPRRGHTRALR
jgi:putative transposase